MRIIVVENVLRFGRPLQTSSEGKCIRKAELVEQAFNAHSMKLAKVCEVESEMKISSWPNYLPQTRVFYQTQHPYWNRTVVGTLQYFQSSPLQIYATIFWERLTSTLKKPKNLLKALRVINCSKMDMFWTSSSWRRTFTFRKRSIRTIRVIFRCCLFLAAKVWVIMVYWSRIST